jgi:hypothetical protein
MEPVELYQCGGSFYVLDGHHRVAVARALGQRSVCALVAEVRLNNPVTVTPEAGEAGAYTQRASPGPCQANFFAPCHVVIDPDAG